jgi:hypothetical protein
VPYRQRLLTRPALTHTAETPHKRPHTLPDRANRDFRAYRRTPDCRRERLSTQRRAMHACSAARCLALVGEMLPELDAVAFRVEETGELALPLGVFSDRHGRGLHAVLV